MVIDLLSNRNFILSKYILFMSSNLNLVRGRFYS
nr:MAG TPA: hypothetical protein [Caudoviricetes sp.]